MGDQPQQPSYKSGQSSTADTTAATVDDLVEAFYNFDYDQDGYIPAEDLRDLLMDNGYNMQRQEVEEFMAEADPSNSGFVEYRALAQLLMQDPEAQ